MVFTEDAIRYLERHRDEIDSIESKCKVKTKISDGRKVLFLKRDESCFTIEGKLKNIRDAIN